MTYITLFSAPKPFSDPHINIIQRNAVNSWLRLGAEVQVLLTGDEPGLAEAATDLGAALCTDVRRNESGTPLISSIFELGREAGNSPILAFANGDMMFLPKLVESIHRIAAQREQWLLIGRRWDLDVRAPLDFSAGWDARLEADVQARGRLHLPAGSDYFVFPRSLYTQVPDFAVGRAGWDNWMIFEAVQRGWTVVDGTPDVMVVHQDHDYRHLPDGKPHYTLPESQHNTKLAGGDSNLYTVLDADVELHGGELQRPPLSAVRLLRKAETTLMPPGAQRRGLRWTLARRCRRLRKRWIGVE
jgi:hypothetical protein